MFADLLRISHGVKESRLTDCLRILTGFVRGSLRISYGFFTGLRRAGLRMAYGFLLDLGEDVYGLLSDFYPMKGRRLTDCLWIFAGFGKEKDYGF